MRILKNDVENKFMQVHYTPYSAHLATKDFVIFPERKLDLKGKI